MVHTQFVCAQYIKMYDDGDTTTRATYISPLFGKNFVQSPHPRCYLGECNACPGIEKLKQELLAQLDENDMDQIV